jgi:hypothetical protein
VDLTCSHPGFCEGRENVSFREDFMSQTEKMGIEQLAGRFTRLLDRRGRDFAVEFFRTEIKPDDLTLLALDFYQVVTGERE